MLKLQHIRKVYPAGDGSVEALKGIDLEFRRSEFVSILGPSGCGKTTMLNIIGGLDGYTEGDLIINGQSTKSFKDRDWDAYRNHSVGFVFQSYNLIPHQTVLQNVELALTLSGVSRSERKHRAAQALEQVGLGDQLNKKPGEMSGGQMQRVAIARALVNNPDIILADEPTGALDTETSVQVMDILKEVSKDRLVIMVTHNPDLAETYSTRIINMLDGLIIADSGPITDEERRQEAEEKQETPKEQQSKKRVKKPSMSFGTSFMLSLKNLFTKKGRTTLTSFAGSIGIIGIALILAVSNGMTTYIDTVQEETLSAYPLTLEASTVDMTALVQTFMDVANEDPDHEMDAVYKKTAVFDMVNAMRNMKQIENDLKAFKLHLDTELAKEGSSLSDAVNGVQYTYDLPLQVYTETVDGKIMHTDLEQIMNNLIAQYVGIDMSAMSDLAEMSPMSSMTSMSTMGMNLWQEMLPGKNGSPINALLEEQYDVVYGSWPNSYDEIVIVLDKNNEIDDITLYALGLVSEEEIDMLANGFLHQGDLSNSTDQSWSYEAICATEYKVILNADCYARNETTGLYNDLRATEAGLRYLYDNALSLKITGVIRPDPDATATMLTGSIGYTHMLTEYLVEKGHGMPVIEDQLNSPDIDVLTGLPFDTTTGTLTDAQKKEWLSAHLHSLDQNGKASAFVAISSVPPAGYVEEQVNAILSSTPREQLEASMLENMQSQAAFSAEDVAAYFEAMSDEDFAAFFTQLMSESLKQQYAAAVADSMSSMTDEVKAASLDAAVAAFTDEQWALYYDEIMVFSPRTYEQNLTDMGYVDLSSPASINIYASSFENKDVIVAAIEKYNNSVDELQKIQYTDYLGLMMSSITTIINAITYVLIAFVSISLIVSSIMIGVITLISVQERTKEIGILRAIGASKRNVSRMFNAETMIVGLTSGLLGVVVTYLLCIPINIILHSLTGINNLSAILPLPAAAILVAISVCLTLISGLIPSRSAAKKDPVVALRTE